MFTINFLQGLIITLIFTHITIVSVTLYLHRSQSHRGLEFTPWLAHFFRFWLWLTTGMITKQWVAVHRKHHRYSDQEGDPHPPINEQRRRWNNLLFPYLTEAGPVEYKLILPLMKRIF